MCDKPLEFRVASAASTIRSEHRQRGPRQDHPSRATNDGAEGRQTRDADVPLVADELPVVAKDGRRRAFQASTSSAGREHRLVVVRPASIRRNGSSTARAGAPLFRRRRYSRRRDGAFSRSRRNAPASAEELWRGAHIPALLEPGVPGRSYSGEKRYLFRQPGRPSSNPGGSRRPQAKAFRGANAKRLRIHVGGYRREAIGHAPS